MGNMMATILKMIIDSMQNPVRFRFLMILLLLSLALGVDQMLTTFKEQSQGNQHPNILTNTYEVNKAITNECTVLQTEVGASRCFVFEFHNGTRNIAGIPFIKMSNTYETVAPGVSIESKHLQNMSVREIVTWLPKLIEDKCITQNAEDADPVLHDLLSAQGIDKVYACPIYFNFRKEPMGFVGVNFNKGWKPSVPANTIEPKLKTLATKISKQLLRVKED